MKSTIIKWLTGTATLLLLVPVSIAQPGTYTYNIQFTDGTFYGPGAMIDAPIPSGYVSHLDLDNRLRGKTVFQSNMPLPASLTKHAKLKALSKALLSNGTPFNGNIFGGIIDIGQGAVTMANLVTAGGPNQGQQHYHLDEYYTWHWTTDFVLDPGFADGIIRVDNITITTGIIWIPPSLQTQYKVPGGFDRAGSLPSGAPLVGKLGDFDFDGYLDGSLVGQATIPMQHIFSPGSPAAQRRTFTSNIPVTPRFALITTLASIKNLKMVFDWLAVRENHQKAGSDDSYAQHYLLELASMLETADQLQQRVSDRDDAMRAGREIAAQLVYTRPHSAIGETHQSYVERVQQVQSSTVFAQVNRWYDAVTTTKVITPLRLK